jgi:hypothetical protein
VKSLTKTESLQTRKSTPEASSPADGEIFFTHRLLQNQKSLTKTDSLHTRKSTPEIVLRLTLKSSAHIDYCRSEIIHENRVAAHPEIITGTEFSS